MINYVLNRRATRVLSFDKRDIVQMSECFLERKSLGKVKVEVYMSNYATKTDLKDATGIETSSFAKKVDLAKI